MKISKACAIFLNIRSKDYSLEEKGAAIKMVCDMPTHNGISKDRMLDVIRWFVDLLYVTGVKTEHSNGDRIRAMSDGELAALLSDDNRACPPQHRRCLEYVDSCSGCWLEWIQQPAEVAECSK